MHLKKNRPVLLLFILLLFLFFRLYNLEDRVIFNWDQARDAQAISQILSGKLTLLGPRVLGPDKFFLAPYFYYLLAPFYWLTNLHPQAITYFLLAYNLVFFILAYLLISKLFNQRVARTFLLLWTVNMAAINADIISWNPLLVPLIVILFLATLEKIFQADKNWLNWFWLGALLGVGINFHFQIIFLVLLAAIFLLVSRKLNWRGLLIALGGFGLAFLPLLMFDLRHNFLNTHLVIDFIFNRDGGGNFFAWVPVWTNFLSTVIGLNLGNAVALIILAGFACFSFWLGKTTRKPFNRKFFLSLAIFLSLFWLGFGVYGQRPSEYYFNFCLPLLFLVLAKLVSRRRWFYFWPLVLVVGWWFYSSQSLLATIPFSLRAKDEAVAYLAQNVADKEINVAFSVPLGQDTGYGYLFDYYGLNIVDQPTSPLYKIIIPPGSEETTLTVAGIGLFIPQ